jgi:hypothetical protein
MLGASPREISSNLAHILGSTTSLEETMHRFSRYSLSILGSMLLCVPAAAAVTPGNSFAAASSPGRQVTLPPAPDPVVIDSLAPDVVAHYDFEYPAQGNSAVERDLGTSGTGLDLVNGGPDMRVQDGAYPASSYSLQNMQVNPAEMGNDDWKAGVYSSDGVASLNDFNAVAGITIMGWFKMTGDNPSPNSNTSDPDDLYNAVGMAGILSGDSDGHAVRALLEVINVDGELRLVALGRRIDGAASQIFAAEEDWRTLLPHDEWVFVAATFNYDDGTMALYHNGERLDGFYTNPGDPWDVGGPGPHVTSATDPAGIKIGGSFPQNNRETNPCNCRMDSLMFLDRVVSDDEVALQYEAFRDTAPATNTAVGGQAVPLEVNLGGYHGHRPFTVSSNDVACTTGEPLDAHEPAHSPHSYRIPYDSEAGTYRYVWLTERPWSGSCRQLTVTTDDGGITTTRFRFD